jgi:hypothetical protein
MSSLTAQVRSAAESEADATPVGALSFEHPCSGEDAWATVIHRKKVNAVGDDGRFGCFNRHAERERLSAERKANGPIRLLTKWH